jgi:hypothetical protein
MRQFDNRDEDGNGYQDDVHGWNFAEQNGHDHRLQIPWYLLA